MRERKPVSPAIAVRLGKLFGDGAGVWVRMQAAYDTWKAERKEDVSMIPHPPRQGGVVRRWPRRAVTKATPKEELRLHHRREQRFRSALGVDQKRQTESLATWTERRIFILMAARLPHNFQCPTCRTEYRVVRIRKPPEPHDRRAFCVCCTRPLQPRDGDFFLKYVKVKPPGNWAIEARLMAVFMTSGA